MQPDQPKEDPIFRAICNHWVNKIELARKHKEKVFGLDADRCMAFYNGPRNWHELMGHIGGMPLVDFMPETLFKMSVNKAFELVTIFGPALYYQVPVRTVTPRKSLDVDPNVLGNPQIAQAVATQDQIRLATDTVRAQVLEAYLNWLPRENHLDEESRQAIDEALLKGRGCLWTELRTPPGTEMRVVCSEFDSVDNLLIDPDAHSFASATWIARRCVHPVWQVEADYGLPRGSLKGNMESQAVQAEIDQDEDQQYDRKRGLTNDLLVYWKIFSKMGVGGRLSGVAKQFRGPLEMFGDFAYLVVARDVPYPLNLPPQLQFQAGESGGMPQEVFARVAWPTPFWADGGWPVTPLDFHRMPKSPWPMSHLKAALGELEFLNWSMSFLAGHIKNSCRDFLAVRKDLDEETKTSLLEGKDLSMIELPSDHGVIAELVQFLQHPPMNGDVWKVIEAVEHNFDKRVGLTDLMYGNTGATQPRSAEEVSTRNQNASVRPEDMARQVEAWMSLVAAKEAVCARLHLVGQQDITPVLGQLAGSLWDQFVATHDPNVATRELEYEIEAGSTRRPNKDTAVARSQESAQTFLPLFQAYGQLTGDFQPLNSMIADWCKARDLAPERYQLRYSMPSPVATSPANPSGQPGSQPHGVQTPSG